MSTPLSEGVTYEGGDLEALADMPNYLGAVLDFFRPYLHGHVAEIGAGIGSFSRLVLPLVERLDLIEPSTNLVAALEGRFAGETKATIMPLTLETYLPTVPPGALDGAILINVLEHIEDDAGMLAHLAATLRPGGYLMLFVPAMPFLYSRMDRLVGHYRRYRRPELVDKVAAAGLRLVKVTWFDALGVLPWWLLLTIGGRTEFDPHMAGLYDRFGVPATRFAERLLPLPFGKNLMLVAERP